MHQWFYKFRSQLHAIDLVIISRVQRWWRHKRSLIWDERVGYVIFVRVDIETFMIGFPFFIIRVSTAHEAILISIHRFLWQLDFFKTIPSSFFEFAKELTKLAASISTEAVEVATVSKSQSMRFTAGDCNHLLILKWNDFCREWLVRLLVGILEQVLGIVKTKLAVGCFTPRKYDSFFGQRHRMGISTSQLNDKLVLKTVNLFWHRHERAGVDV